MKTGMTPNYGWTASSHAVIEFVRNSKASCRPTGRPWEPTEGGSRRTWTFDAVTSRASRLASPLWGPTSRRAPPKGTSKMTHPTEMSTLRCLWRPEPMTLPLIVPLLQSLALTLIEVDEGAVEPPPSSPVSRDDDDLLSGNVAAGVEAGLAHLTISPPQWTRGGGRGSLKCGCTSPSRGSLIAGPIAAPQWPPDQVTGRRSRSHGQRLRANHQ